MGAGPMAMLKQPRTGKGSVRQLRESAGRGRSRNLSVKAGWDAAGYDPDNAAHYLQADNLSARAAASPEVRRVLRTRCRHEVANNSILMGLLTTIANDVVGRGPRLEVEEVNGVSEGDADQTEEAFHEWCDDIGLPEKLRTMRFGRAVDGESFAVFFTNPRATNEVQLDLRLIEADQIATSGMMVDPTKIDGLEIDQNGVVIAYHVLKSHPGDIGYGLGALSHDRFDASEVIHWFRPTRPGQYRGIPEISPSLRTFAQLRRFTAAVLTAAEQAANLAGVIYTDATPNDDEDIEAGDEIPIERGTWRTLPKGYKLGQMQAEHPSTTYSMFKGECISDAARCVLAPSLVVKGDASGYNYASGRLDMQSYHRANTIERRELELVVMRRVFARWLEEAVLIEGLLPLSVRQIAGRAMGRRRIKHTWWHERVEHVDPTKEAQALTAELAAGVTTRAIICAERQLDSRKVIKRLAQEAAAMRAAGLTPEMPGQPAPQGAPAAEDPDEANEPQEQP